MSKSKKANKDHPVQEDYPTEWQGGIPRGSLQEKPNFYRVVISAPSVDQYNRSFYFVRPHQRVGADENQIFDDNDDALEAANRYRMQESNRHGLTRNQWRKIDTNTIEVKLDENTTFFTDHKHVKKVEQYPIFAKKAHNKFHIISQDKKRQFPFHNLIKPEITKIVEYIDGNTMNLRETNLREFGAVEVSAKVQIKAETDESYDFTINHYALTKYEDMPYVLPKNKWILGKPAGTIFERDKHIVARITNGDKYASKTFKFDETTKDSQNEAAKRWQYAASYKRGLTKNLIKILDDKHVEIQITKDFVIQSSIELIPLIQYVFVCATKSSNADAKSYAMVSAKGKSIKFHNLICQNAMTDHINGETLDNTLENLRSCTYSINNSNRHFEEEKVGYEMTDRDGNKAIFAKIKIEGKVFEKYFYFKTTDSEEIHAEKARLFENAYLYRQFVLYGKWNDRLSPYLKHKDFRIISKHFHRLIEHQKDQILSKTNYIDGLKKQTDIVLTPLAESNIYRIYLKTRVDQLSRYSECMNNLADLMFQKLKKNNNIKVIKKIHQGDLTELKSIIRQKGGIIITPDQEIGKTPISIRCKCKYVFNMKPEDIITGKYCYACHDNTLETLTRQIIQEITKKTFVKTKPLWLINDRGNQMEIDMYNDELKLGIEYDGKQHDKLTYYSKTQDKLNHRMEDDQLKRKLCRVNGVTLICVPHVYDTKESIEQFISLKLQEFGFDYSHPIVSL